MRKKIIPFLIACGFIANAQTNLLPTVGNYGFESGISNNAYWWYLNGSPTYANFLWQTTDVHSGSAAYQLNITTAGTQKWHVQVVSSQNTAATYPTLGSTVSYTLQFWMKTTNGGGTVRVSNVGSAPYSNDLTITQGGWTLYSFVFNGNDTTYRPSIDIGTANAGTYYIDDIALYQTTTLSTNDVKTSSINTEIYPNPAKDFITINDKITNTKSVNIYDLNGRKVLSSQSAKNVNISTLSKGIYILKTDQGEAYKFIKD